ncbi:MAG: YfhO family protein [Prevotella sp.]|nr:YfhO family protein [Alistipes senegalensis]MCM1357798.1 YfhO family protein [Prevotella sp.]MCM1472508.1 YfhO family protein [Muribaculaceae bacterium]
MSKSKTGSKQKPAFTASDVIAAKTKVKYKPIYYVAAFLIPALLTLIAYAFFGIYPFDERSVLALDLNGQYIYYFEAIRDAFWGDGSVFYNWSRNLSGEFMGITGYYLASPFTLIVILMPRSMLLEAMMIMQLCKVGAAGLTFCIYAQKSKNVPALQSILFSTMYAMMSYVAIQLIDPMWIDGPVFLPLIILGVEYLIDDGRKLNYIIPLAIMFVAEFYIGYMIAIFVAIYFFYYLFFGTKRKFKNAGEYFKTFCRMALATIVVLMCSIFMILPVYNGLSNGKFNFSDPDYSYKHMFELLELIPIMLPNQYYSVNVDETSRLYGRPEIYCGVLTFVLLPLFFMNKKVKTNRKIGYGLITFIMITSMYVKPINMLWHGGQDPNWLPYRYSFLLSFVFVAMAAEAFSNLDGYKLSVGSVAGTFTGIAVLVAFFNERMPKYNYNEDRYKYVATVPYKTTETYHSESHEELWLGTLVFGVLLAAVYLIYLYFYSHAKKKTARNAMSIAVACLVFFEAGYNAYDTFKKINKEVAYSDKSTYAEIMSAPDVVKHLEEYDSGFYRSEKTYQRCVNDNLAYGLKGISHSSSVMNAKAIKFADALGYFTQSYETQYKGNNVVADSLLGIKYVIDDPNRNSGNRSLLEPHYEKVTETTYINNNSVETNLDIYENKDALPIAYGASEELLMLGHLGNDNQFNSMNILLSTLTGNTDFQTTEEGAILINGFKEYYKRLEPEAYEGDSVFDPNQVRHSIYSPTDENGNVIPSKVHHAYDALPNAIDPVVNMHITTQYEGPLYMHIDSDFYKGVNIWVSTDKDENGNYYNHQEYGNYLKDHIRPIVRLGSYPAGTEVEVRFTITKTDGSANYVGSNEHFMFKENGGLQLYNLDYEAFHNDIEQLKQHQFIVDTEKSNDRYIEGTVNIAEGQMLFTTIPYEDGWSLKIDGKKANDLITEIKNEDGTIRYQNDADAETGKVIALESTIGLKLPAGEHTITMKYTPPGFNLGMFTLILGIGIIILFYMYDKKNNEILIAIQKEKENPQSANKEESAKKKVQIIKTKGAVAEQELIQKKTDDDTEEDNPEPEPNEE